MIKNSAELLQQALPSLENEMYQIIRSHAENGKNNEHAEEELENTSVLFPILQAPYITNCQTSKCNKDELTNNINTLRHIFLPDINALISTPIDPLAGLTPKERAKFDKLCTLTPQSKAGDPLFTCQKEDTDLQKSLLGTYGQTINNVHGIVVDTIKSAPFLKQLPVDIFINFYGSKHGILGNYTWRNGNKRAKDVQGGFGSFVYPHLEASLTRARSAIITSPWETDQEPWKWRKTCEPIDAIVEYPHAATDKYTQVFKTIAMNHIQTIMHKRPASPAEDPIFNTKTYADALTQLDELTGQYAQCEQFWKWQRAQNQSKNKTQQKSSDATDTLKLTGGILLGGAAGRGIGKLL